MSGVSLIPQRAWVPAGDRAVVDVIGGAQVLEPTTVVVRHLGEAVSSHVPAATVDLGVLPPGGYGVELVAQSGVTVARTAIEVRRPGARRLRYGFVADYSPGRDVGPAALLARRLHLTSVQFYDWAYRHADLVGGGEEYADALAQPVALETVRRLIAAFRHVGVESLGYAAVYAVGRDEWPRWSDLALVTPDGGPHGLGGFLSLVDPAAPRWLDHFSSDLQSARRLGFDGFHLDQYGSPKAAARPDGAIVDLAQAFGALVNHVRAEQPDACLVFNNVNGFPVWASTSWPQDAVYIEPWAPQTTLGSLAALVVDARSRSDLPIVVAAYQSLYSRAPARVADRAAQLTMATLFSHGATQLLAGESGHLLVDPYYVHNHPMDSLTRDLLVRWYDFLVEHDELLAEPSCVDVTACTAGPYNDDIVVSGEGVTVSTRPEARTVWQRNVRVGGRLVVHLINLVDQVDTLWDEPRAEHRRVAGLVVRIRRIAGQEVRVSVADPDGGGCLVAAAVMPETDSDHVRVALPDLSAWLVAVVVMEPTPA